MTVSTPGYRRKSKVAGNYCGDTQVVIFPTTIGEFVLSYIVNVVDALNVSSGDVSNALKQGTISVECFAGAQ